MVDKRFKVGVRLGHGAFGQLYKGVDQRTGQEVAIKLEPVDAPHPQLHYEARLYALLQKNIGIPRLIWSGQEGAHNVLVLELLGKNLEDLVSSPQCNNKFSLKTILMLADGMLRRIQSVHAAGFVHRDIKPDNFVMGPPHGKRVYILDFGLSKAYWDPVSKAHIPYRDDKSLTGTPRYASVHAHQGIEQSRRDDMEAIGYVLIYLFKGSLPWQTLHAKKGTNWQKEIGVMKAALPLEELCEGLPSEFLRYMQYCRGLEFEETPNYGHWIDTFRGLYHTRKFPRDNLYDWNK